MLLGYNPRIIYDLFKDVACCVCEPMALTIACYSSKTRYWWKSQICYNLVWSSLFPYTRHESMYREWTYSFTDSSGRHWMGLADWVANFTPPAALPPRKAPGNQWIGFWVCPTVSLPTLIWTPDRPACSPVTTPATLSLLLLITCSKVQ